MNWKDKMKEMVESILNEDCPGFYKFNFKSDKEYCIERKGIQVLNTETIVDLSSHWIEYAKRAIIFVIEMKINIYQLKNKQ